LREGNRRDPFPPGLEVRRHPPDLIEADAVLRLRRTGVSPGTDSLGMGGGFQRELCRIRREALNVWIEHPI
jgi:hypothetical protein